MNHSIPSASRIPKIGPMQYQVDFLVCQLGTVPTCTPLPYYSSAWNKVLFKKKFMVALSKNFLFIMELKSS